jgi:NAD(P)-dependent dehydrogenase (short-subunit alcohol dehydrogenase family)
VEFKSSRIVALVTGGSAGIGRACVLGFAKRGARVVVADIDADAGRETVREVEEGGGEGSFIRVDVSCAQDVEAMVRHTVATYGSLDCAVNNAGIEGVLQPIVDASEENWIRVIDINLKGVWLCLKYEIAQMRTQGGGTIVNTSSAAGLCGVPTCGAYVASKHGVLGLTKTASIECGKDGIRVNAVCPGPIQTPMLDRLNINYPGMIDAYVEQYPLHRVGTPDEVAEAVIWLCSDAASFVTGHIMPIDGGYFAT